MTKKKSNLQGQKPTKKIVASKKESKKYKINTKKGVKKQPSKSSLDEDE